MEVSILRKVLDYSFIENKVCVAQVETIEYLKDEIKAMFNNSNGFRLRFWDTNYTNALIKIQKNFLQLFLLQLT